MMDARSVKPVVNDTFAESMLGEEGLRVFEAFRSLRYPNGASVARHRIIDELLQERFRARPRRLTVLIGAGYDSRPFRMRTGEWVEFDAPEIIARKELLLPSRDCPVALQRFGIDFASDALAERLAPFATDRKVSVVVEGVLPYLEPAAVERLVKVLQELFPHHTLICDLVTRRFLERYGAEFRAACEGLGATIRWAVDDPVALFEGLGYSRFWATSIVLRAAESGCIPAPAWPIRWFLRCLRDGYAVHVLKHSPTGAH